MQRKRPAWFTLIPMAFMMLTTLGAMWSQLSSFNEKEACRLFGVGGLLLVIAVWLVIEAILAVRRYRRGETTDDMEIRFEEG